MKLKLALLLLVSVLLLGTAGPAEAKGCIRGALVGGAAGHYAGHPVLGAVGGCIVGRRMANNKIAQDRAELSRQQSPVANYDTGNRASGYALSGGGPGYGVTPSPAQRDDANGVAPTYTGGAYHR